MLILTYQSYCNFAPSYLCELINKKSHMNTRLGTDHHQLIMPPISMDCSNTFLVPDLYDFNSRTLILQNIKICV